MIAPSNDHPLSDMVPIGQLPDFLFLFWGQCRCQYSPISTPNLDASTSAVPPPDPYDSKEITLQLMDEVRTLSVQQTSI